MASSDEPRAKYREIYSLITAAEKAHDEGDLNRSAQLYADVISQLESFQSQHPSWEPDIVKFRLFYAHSQLKQIKGKMGGGGGADAHGAHGGGHAPAASHSEPAYQNHSSGAEAHGGGHSAAPSYSGGHGSAPAPPSTHDMPALSHGGGSSYAPSTHSGGGMSGGHGAAVHNTEFSANKYDAMGGHSTRPPARSTSALPSTSNSGLRGLQMMVQEIENEVSRLSEQNRQLRVALADAESRAASYGNQVKILSQQNDEMRARLNAEIKAKENLRALLQNELAAYTTRWEALRRRVNELLQGTSSIPGAMSDGGGHSSVLPASSGTFSGNRLASEAYRQEIQDRRSERNVVDSYLTH